MFVSRLSEFANNNDLDASVVQELVQIFNEALVEIGQGILKDVPTKSTTTKIDTIIKKTKLTKFIAPTGVITSDDGDYKQPYDKGHLAPKQSFPNEEYNDFMFSFLNSH